MEPLRIALVQATATRDREANLGRGIDLCRQAHVMGADIALFPEMWSHGYRMPHSTDAKERSAWSSTALSVDAPFLERFRALSRELEMAIAITYLQRWEPKPRNSVTLFDRRGEIALTYAKVHTCEFDREAALMPGDGFPVAAVDTRCGSVRIGAMICYDREFPESARLLMLGGAEIVLVPNACTLEEHRLGQFRARAYENMIGLAMANYPAPQANGHSIAVHPIAFGRDERPQSTMILEAGEDEGIFVAAFDLEAIRDYRRREAWGDAYRRPRLYGALVSDDVREPFVRNDATR